jgi:hypothetical protein
MVTFKEPPARAAFTPPPKNEIKKLSLKIEKI